MIKPVVPKVDQRAPHHVLVEPCLLGQVFRAWTLRHFRNFPVVDLVAVCTRVLREWTPYTTRSCATR